MKKYRILLCPRKKILDDDIIIEGKSPSDAYYRKFGVKLIQNKFGDVMIYGARRISYSEDMTIKELEDRMAQKLQFKKKSI